MLTAGVLAFDAAGRIRTLDVAEFPNPNFNGGTPVGDLGSLVIAPDASGYNVEVEHAGLGYLDNGAIVVSIGGGGTTWVAGLPINSDGQLEVSFDQAVARYIAGIPLDGGGKVALAAPTPPINLSGFDLGFDEEAFA